MVSMMQCLDVSSRALAGLVLVFFFGGGVSLVLYYKMDPSTGLRPEEAVYLCLAFSVYAIFGLMSRYMVGLAYYRRPSAIFEMGDVPLGEFKASGPRFRNVGEESKAAAPSAELKTEADADRKSRKAKKKKRKSKSRRRAREVTPTRDASSSVEPFSLGSVMRAAVGTPKSRLSSHALLEVAGVAAPLVFLSVPLVPCWLRDAGGGQCSGSGSPTAVLIIVWNCTVTVLLGAHYGGMVLTLGALLRHGAAMAGEMRTLVDRIESIDHLEAWHATMGALSAHLAAKLQPFQVLAAGTSLFALLFTAGTVALSAAHLGVGPDDAERLRAAWYQLLVCAVVFSACSVLTVACAARINARLGTAVTRLDKTGGGREVSLAQFYATVIEHWKKAPKGVALGGVRISDTTCFYFTTALGALALTPILIAGAYA